MSRDELSCDEARALHAQVTNVCRYFARLCARAEEKGLAYTPHDTGCLRYLLAEVERKLHALMTHLHYESCFTEEEISQRRKQQQLPLEWSQRKRPTLTVVPRKKET